MALSIMAVKGSLPLPKINRNNTDPLQAFQDFCRIPDLWLKDQKPQDADKYIKIVYFLSTKGTEIWKYLDGLTMMTTRILPKYSTDLRPAFKHQILYGATEKRTLS